MIFIDRSIPRAVASALKQDRDDVVWLDEVFHQATPDEEWLREVGARGWIVISRDKKIRTRPGERREILESGVDCFILASKKDMPKEDMVALIRRTLPEIERMFATTKRPFIFTIDSAGRFRQYA